MEQAQLQVDVKQVYDRYIRDPAHQFFNDKRHKILIRATPKITFSGGESVYSIDDGSKVLIDILDKEINDYFRPRYPELFMKR